MTKEWLRRHRVAVDVAIAVFFVLLDAGLREPHPGRPDRPRRRPDRIGVSNS
ncbi:MAG: hypothetical protein ACRDNF_21560 [Streptosporangiaceae bacterium]